MVGFIVGLLLGGFIGVVVMAIFTATKEKKEKNDYNSLYLKYLKALDRTEGLLKTNHSLVKKNINTESTLKCTESRLRHLLQSRFIRSFDSVLYKSNQYSRDIKEADEIVGLAPNNKPFIPGELLIERCRDPIEYLESLIACDVKDWGSDNRLAAIYAIVLGWDDPSYSELKDRFHWSQKYIELLKQNHTTMARLKADLHYARWIKCETADYKWKCSRCGYGYTDNKTSYCYDCGAMMEDVFLLSGKGDGQ